MNVKSLACAVLNKSVGVIFGVIVIGTFEPLTVTIHRVSCIAIMLLQYCCTFSLTDLEINYQFALSVRSGFIQNNEILATDTKLSIKYFFLLFFIKQSF